MQLFEPGIGATRHELAAALPAVLGSRRVRAHGDRQRVVVVVDEAPLDQCLASLTPRERAVANCLARGLTNCEIAAELFVSIATVKDHVHHILTKTGLPNRAAVAGRWRAGAAASASCSDHPAGR